MTADVDPVLRYLDTLGPGSQVTMRRAITIVEALLRNHMAVVDVDWGAVRIKHTAAVREALIERYAPAQVNKVLCALRGILKQAWRIGVLASDHFHWAVQVPTLEVDTTPHGRVLSMGELRALFGACASDARLHGARDAAMLAVMCMGLRRAEVVAIDLSDYCADSAELFVRGRRRERITYAPPGCARALDGWLATRGLEAGALFFPINKSGRIVPRRLHNQTVLDIITRRAQLAGVGPVAPQDLRRTFIESIIAGRGDLAIAQQLVGHSTVTSTARYEPRQRLRKVPLLHVPYQTC